MCYNLHFSSKMSTTPVKRVRIIRGVAANGAWKWCMVCNAVLDNKASYKSFRPEISGAANLVERCNQVLGVDLSQVTPNSYNVCSSCLRKVKKIEDALKTQMTMKDDFKQTVACNRLTLPTSTPTSSPAPNASPPDAVRTKRMAKDQGTPPVSYNNQERGPTGTGSRPRKRSLTYADGHEQQMTPQEIIEDTTMNCSDFLNLFFCKFCGRHLESLDRFKRHIARHQRNPAFGLYHRGAQRKPCVSRHQTWRNRLQQQLITCSTGGSYTNRSHTQHITEYSEQTKSDLTDYFQTQTLGERELDQTIQSRPITDVPFTEDTICSHIRTDSANWCTCPHCNKYFAKSNLKAHVRIHTGEKPYQCSKCTMRFAHSSNLKMHYTRHQTDDKPFACTRCEKRFTHSSSRALHMRTHSGDRPYQCVQCDKSFKLKTYLNVHIVRIHTGERPYQCPICDKRYQYKSTQTRHMETHSKNQCMQCGMHFANKRDRTAHTRNTHTVIRRLVPKT